MACMSVLGFSGVLANAVVAFIPLGLLLARRLGLDPVCGVAVMYVGCYSGFAPSAMCPPPRSSPNKSPACIRCLVLWSARWSGCDIAGHALVCDALCREGES